MVDFNMELDSFILKFKQLWKEGLDAHLDVETHAGNAWVGLKLNLGQHPLYSDSEVRLKRVSTSRTRRRERRANSFKKQNDDKTDLFESNDIGKIGEDTLVTMNHDIKVNTTEEVATSDVKNAISNDTDTNVVEKMIISENGSIENAEIFNAVADAVLHTDIEVVEETIIEEDCIQDKPVENLETTEVAKLVTGEVNVSKESNCDSSGKVTGADNADLCVKASGDSDAPQLATVYSTAVIENSPYPRFSNDEWESIGRFATNKDHLKKNIININHCRSFTRNTGIDLYEHTVEILILVNIGALWQSPRAYLWKHIGQDVWERGIGSKIRLTKIHQK